MQTPKHFFWWMVVLSVGLHAAGSWVPWIPSTQGSSAKEEDILQSANETSETESPELESAAIALVQLPPSALSSAPPKKSIATPATSTEVASTQQLGSSVASETIEPPVEEFVENAGQNLAAETSEPEEIQSVFDQADPLEENSKSAKTETSSQLETSALTEDGAIEDASTNHESNVSTEGVLVTLTDFPHLSGTQSGCFGLSQCHQSQGNYREVGKQLTEQMRQQGYQLTPKDNIDEAGHRVFEVVHPDEPDQIYYLNVFSDGLDSAVYALTLDILSLEDLKKLNA